MPTVNDLSILSSGVFAQSLQSLGFMESLNLSVCFRVDGGPRINLRYYQFPSQSLFTQLMEPRILL